MSRAEARAEAIGLGLTVVSVRKKPAAAQPGAVLAQSLQPGTSVMRGRGIRLVVASPLPRVPGIIGVSRASATARLQAKGFRVITTKRSVTSGRDDVVLSQSPRAGTSVRPGATITLVVADYHPPAPAPSNCTPGYSPCLPPASDYDCAGGSGNGPKYVYGQVEVTGPDIYDLDRDGDGIGCD